MRSARPLFTRIRSLSVGRKLVLIYILGIFAPLLVANGLVLRSVLIDVRRQEELFLRASVHNMAANVVREFQPVLLSTEFVYADFLIYRLLSVSYDSFQAFVQIHREQLMPALAKYVSVFPAVKRMLIYSDNPILRVSEGYLSLDDYSRGTIWYSRLRSARPGIVAMVHTESDPRLVLEPQPILSVFRELDNPATFGLGAGRLLLRVDVNAEVLRRGLGPSEIVGSVEVVDPEGTVVVARGLPVYEQRTYEFDYPLSPVVAFQEWRIRGSIAPAQAIAPWPFQWTRLLIASGFSLVVSSVFILILSRSVTSRLTSLSGHMLKVQREDFSPLKLPRTSDDEIGQLIDDFNLMARKIDELINSGYKLELERHQLLLARQQAELRALQSQVNPHFLYNVLESIRMKAHLKGEVETARIVKKLSRSFRRITTWDDDLVPLEEEIAFTREYLEIQQYRFGSRLTARVEMDADAGWVLVPKMTVQGLVENACVHGIERKPDGGLISIVVARSGLHTSIRVSDDGIGCDAAGVRHSYLEGSASDGHIGITNIKRRLELHYGAGFTFGFESTPGAGTTVELVIPLAEQDAPPMRPPHWSPS